MTIDLRELVDHKRKEYRESLPESPLPADHPGFKECGTCGAYPRVDLEQCPLCGTVQ